MKWLFYFLYRASRIVRVRVDVKVPRLFTKDGPDFSSRLRVDIIMAHSGVSGSGPHSHWIHPIFGRSTLTHSRRVGGAKWPPPSFLVKTIPCASRAFEKRVKAKTTAVQDHVIVIQPSTTIISSRVEIPNGSNLFAFKSAI